MPSHDGLGLHEDEVAPPVAAKAPGQEPEELVASTDGGALAGRPGEDGELVAQEGILDDEGAAAAERSRDAGEQEGEQLEHASRIAQPGPDLLRAAFCRPSAALERNQDTV